MTLGVDVGGSSIKVVSLEGDEVTLVARVPHRARGLVELLDVLATCPLPGPPPLRGGGSLGVAIAGLVSGRHVARSGNLELTDAPFLEAFEKKLGRRIGALISDANAVGRAALRETSNERLVFALALGTGVGGAIIESGRIVRDVGVGHGIRIEEVAAAPCAIGHPSCLEAHVGAAALARAGGAASVEELDQRAEAGDLVASRLLEAAGALVGRSLAPITRGLSARLVLSGGVASSRSLQRGAGSTFPGPVVFSRYGTLAAAAGAAFAARGPLTPP